MNILKFLTFTDITFLIDVDKALNVDKSGKASHFKMINLDDRKIKHFLDTLQLNHPYLINAMISINCRISDPYINLSRQFLITRESNLDVISRHLQCQIDKARNTLLFNTDQDYFLIFKYKKVTINYRQFSTLWVYY